MTLQAMSWAFARDLPPGDKVVLLVLANRANADHETWHSQARIAAEASLSRETVNRALKRLEAAGLLVALREGGNPREGPNRSAASHATSARAFRAG